MIAGRFIFRVAVVLIVVAVLLLGVRFYQHAHKAHRLVDVITTSHSLAGCVRSYHRYNESYPDDLQAAVPQGSKPDDYRRWFSDDVQITYTKPSGEGGVERRMLVVDYDDYEIIYDSEFHRTVREK